MVPERWSKQTVLTVVPAAGRKEIIGSLIQWDQRRTACNREDVGGDTTTILVADDVDGRRNKSPVVLKPSST